MKKTILSILTLGIFNVTSITLNIPVSALTYSDNIGVDFTFDTSLGVSLSSTSGGSAADLVINNLTPGASSDSNVIDINVISNNLSGYVLNSTVGSSSLYNDNHAIYSTDALIHSTYTSADNTDITTGTYDKPIFANITTDVSSLTVDNTWGYSYSIDGGTTWVNQSGTTDGYSGLPLYTSTPAELYSTTGPSAPTGDNTYFKIAAKASPTQASGEYSNVVNFTVVGNTNPTSFYDAFKEAQTIDPTITMLNGYYKMQDMNTSICNSVYTSQLADNTDTMEAQLIDIRDNNIYWVAKLKDGYCWMTQNLAVKPGTSMTAADTNIAGIYTEDNPYTLPADNHDLKRDGLASDGNCYGDYVNDAYTGSGWSEPCSHAADATDMEDVSSLGYTIEQLGVWYNYAAATAGDISGALSNTYAATSDICPKNWQLPSNVEQRNMADAVSANNAVFRPISNGYYYHGMHYAPILYGHWWSKDASSGSSRYNYHYYRQTEGLGNGNTDRYFGYNVRCLANN